MWHAVQRVTSVTVRLLSHSAVVTHRKHQVTSVTALAAELTGTGGQSHFCRDSRVPSVPLLAGQGRVSWRGEAAQLCLEKVLK